MEGRTVENYIDVLKKVIDVVKISPDIIMTDFEKAERNALQTIFPSAQVIGCFFHYSQVIKDNAYIIINRNGRQLFLHYFLITGNSA